MNNGLTITALLRKGSITIPFLSLLTSTVINSAAAEQVGKLKIFRNANGYFDNFDINPTPADKAAILSLYDGLEVYSSPFSFDPDLSWYSNGFFYQDLEAIYVGQSVAAAHPEWIIKGANGNNLYVNFGCSGGTCPAYMADLGNPDFRAYWISQAQQTMAKGYNAIFIDDASMTMRASDGNGNPATMIDPRTGQAVTLSLWQQWNVTFFQEIRAAFPAPSYRIMQNVIWFADTGQATPNPLIDQQIKLLDYFYLEFGINDPGITGGTGQFSMQKELDMLLRVKANGANFGLAGVTADEPGEELAFAFAMLATDGNDFLGDDNQYPTNPVAWYRTNLGAPLGTYYITGQGVYERDFQYGSVIVNPPQANTVQVSKPGFYDLLGNQNTFMLSAKTGKILFGPPACNILTFLGGTVPTTPVAPGGSYNLTCNYGVVVNSILAFSGGSRCTYQGFSSTIAQFTCRVPTTARRTLTNICSLVGSTSSNSCAQTNPLPFVVVTPPASHDFNGDGKSDIAWRNTNGDTAIWGMNGTTVSSTGGLGNVANSWQIVGQRDFNGDGMADLLWSNTNGDTAIWLMNGTQVSTTQDLGIAGNGWSIVGTGDFNGDGFGDILWRNTNGDTAIWLMTGTATQVRVLSATDLGVVPTSWSVAQTGDFNGDGNADILWRNTNGDTAMWLMTANGTQARVLSATGLGMVPTSWTIAGTGDFNRDPYTDILWHNSNGDAAIWLMTGNATQVQVFSAIGLGSVPTSWSVIQTGDFNGDGSSDILWGHTNGDIAIWFMTGTATQVQVLSATTLGTVPTSWVVQGAGAD